ncbi:pilus assembly protein [Thioclava sp. 'Guangxiensis']|uniref:pilus assembly protein n=1 Tax=Thioclava sp. 'Guangxiensis' TaxID=3149044 RepID=UPI0038782A1A
MKLFRMTKKIRNEEDGAVTVDWVVLTAAIVGIGVAIVTLVGKKIYSSADAIDITAAALTEDDLKAGE